MRWLVLIALLVSVRAQAKTKKPRVVLFDIPADSAFSPNVTKTLNDFLAGALADQGFEVLTSQDMVALIGLEKQKELLGCSDGSCLADLGGALGADYVVRGNVAVLDNDTAVALTLIDGRGKPIQIIRQVVSGRSSSALLKALEDLVPRLMAPVKPTPPTVGPALSPTAAGSPTPSPVGGLTSSATPAEAPTHTSAYVLLGVGAAGLVASAVLGALSYSNCQSYYSQAGRGASASTLSATQSTSNTEAGVAWGALGVGVAGAVLGTYFLFSGESPAPAPSNP